MLRLALLVLPLCLAAQTVPTPESVLGHKPGDDFYLASYDDARTYYQKLAATSNRIKLITVGKTTRGVPWEIAIISSPENLAGLDHYKAISKKLALARGLNDTEAHALAREGKAIVHLDGGMHSTEVAGAQHSLNLAYHLVSAQNDPQVDAILNNVILMLWPTLNPDGQNAVVAWYRKNVGTPYEVSPLPDLYQEYVGHDNNRDGYMNNMLESQEVTRTELEWDPVIFYSHHQTAPFPTRMFIPPFTEPISSNIHPLMARWLSVLGMNIAAYLDEHDMPGAVHRVGFDNWYPGFLDFTHIFRNSISFFTETALYRYATPHFYTVDEFPKERQELRSEVLYSSPWKGGWWRLADAVRYMRGASMSVLDTAAKYREQLLYNRYQAGRDNIRKFQLEPPFAYVIPHEQRDLPTAALLVEKLLTNGLEVFEGGADFHANGRVYRNAWIVPMDQPFSPLVKELFETQHYPDLRTTPNGPPIRPYDVAGWTLPMQMGVQTDAVLEPISADQRAALTRITTFTAPVGTVAPNTAVFTLTHQANSSFAAINQVLAKGGQVSFDSKNGTSMVTGIDRAELTRIAAAHSAVFEAAPKGEAGISIRRKPRIGLYRSWMANIDEGWTRWILLQYGFAPVTVRNGDLQAGHLLDQFDTIILPDAAQKGIADGFAPGTVPGVYSGGIGDSGADALREFVKGGGTLIAFNNASLYAINVLSLPVTNILTALTNDQFYCSGSLLRVERKTEPHPALWGLPAEPIIMFESGPVFETKPNFRGTVLATYSKDRNPLASGYLLHPEVIQGKVAALEAYYGSGRVYLFGFRPQWRAQSHGGYKFVFNAIYDSPAVATPTVGPATLACGSPEVSPLATKIHTELAGLLTQNRAFSAAKGEKAIEEKTKLNAAIDRFQRETLPQPSADYTRQLRTFSEDLRSKEFDIAATLTDLLEKYSLTKTEQEMAKIR
jgi:hypothetical protein